MSRQVLAPARVDELAYARRSPSRQTQELPSESSFRSDAPAPKTRTLPVVALVAGGGALAGLCLGFGLGQMMDAPLGRGTGPFTIAVGIALAIAVFLVLRALRRGGASRVEQDDGAGTSTGNAIEHALAAPGCAGTHSVSTIARAGAPRVRSSPGSSHGSPTTPPPRSRPSSRPSSTSASRTRYGSFVRDPDSAPSRRRVPVRSTGRADSPVLEFPHHNRSPPSTRAQPVPLSRTMRGSPAANAVSCASARQPATTCEHSRPRARSSGPEPPGADSGRDPRPVRRKPRRRRGEESSIVPPTAGGGPIRPRVAHDSGERANTSRRVHKAHRIHARRSRRRSPLAMWRSARAATAALRANKRSQALVIPRTAAVGHAGGGGSGWSVRASRRGARPGREGEGFPGGTNRHAPGRTAR